MPAWNTHLLGKWIYFLSSLAYGIDSIDFFFFFWQNELKKNEGSQLSLFWLNG